MNLQVKILRYLERQPNTWVIKVEAANQRGCPDILCCCKGQFWAIEVKEGKQYASSIQHAQLERIEAAGGRSIVVRSMEGIRVLVATGVFGKKLKGERCYESNKSKRCNRQGV